MGKYQLGYDRLNNQVAENFPKQNNDSEEKNSGSSEDEPESSNVSSVAQVFQIPS